MGVVARLNVHAVEHTIWGCSYKMQPVISNKDMYDDEISRFFAATPGGSVYLAIDKGEEELFVPGDQCYLYFDSACHPDDLPFAFQVTLIKLDGWATTVEFTAKGQVVDGVTYRNGSKMSFTIRNEIASEQFQIGSTVYVRLQKINA